MLGHPHSGRLFPDVQKKSLVFQFVHIASGPLTEYHWKEFDSIFFTSSLQVFIRFKVCLSLHFSRLNKTSSLNLSLYERCYSPLIILVSLHWILSSSCMSLLYWRHAVRLVHLSLKTLRRSSYSMCINYRSNENKINTFCRQRSCLQ